MLSFLFNIPFLFISHNSKPQQAVCVNLTSMRQEGKRWVWSHGSTLTNFHSGKWFTPDRQTGKDFSLCFQGSCESYTKLFSLSWLSSLTETKRLSFFLTPPNSLKCHRSTVSWCWMERRFQTRWRYFLFLKRRPRLCSRIFFPTW